MLLYSPLEIHFYSHTDAEAMPAAGFRQRAFGGRSGEGSFRPQDFTRTYNFDKIYLQPDAKIC